jgi:hypothetical protein
MSKTIFYKMENPATKIKNYVILLLKVQGGYYFLTGVWPIIHIDSFIWVTGPKDDIWLVKSFGLIIAIVGLTFIIGSRSNQFNWPVISLAMLSAVGFIAIDTYYVFTDIIPIIYLGDAVAQFILLILWGAIMILINKNY